MKKINVRLIGSMFPEKHQLNLRGNLNNKVADVIQRILGALVQ